MSNDDTQQPTVSKLAFRVFGSANFETEPVEFKICNISSFCFYVVQAFYCVFLLYKLCYRTELKPRRSKSLILATAMILYSSIVLACLFGKPSLAIRATTQPQDPKADEDQISLSLRIYLILCQDLPFCLMFFSHLLIFQEYIEFAVVLHVLCNLKSNWSTASNKLTSLR